MKKILFAAVTLFLSIAPATFAQPPGRPPGAKPDTEKKDEPEKPAPELKVTAGQANYIRGLRLHVSQKEVERNDIFSIFTMFIRPTFDFIQELFWQGEDVEVLEPQWLREEMAAKIERMFNRYKKD